MSPRVSLDRVIGRAAITLLAAATLVACGNGSGESAKKPAPAVPVVLETLAPRAWSDHLEALGTAQARESVMLTAKITETVKRVNFNDGDKVSAGDILVELTGNQQIAQLADAQAMARDAARQYERQQDLAKAGTVSKAAYENAQAQRDSAEAKAGVIRAQLSDRVISAPFAGVLGLRRVSPGTLVTPGTPIVTLDDIGAIKLDFPLPETELANIAIDQEVSATSAAFPGRTFKGRVASIDSRVDPVTRAIVIRALVPNADAALRPGMLLVVAVDAQPRDVLAVPELALVPIGIRQFLFRVDADGVAHQVEVAIGARRDGRVEIRRGVAAGDRIVVEGTVNLREGAKVAEAAASG